MTVPRRQLINAGPVRTCMNGCGSPVRVSQYEGGQPRLNRVIVTDGEPHDLPGGHGADDCELARGQL